MHNMGIISISPEYYVDINRKAHVVNSHHGLICHSINIFLLKRVVMDTIVRLREQRECISTPTFYNVDSVRTCLTRLSAEEQPTFDQLKVALKEQLEPLEACGMSFHCTLIQIHSNAHL